MQLEPRVIFSSGVAATGKSTTMREFCRLVSNALILGKDTINAANLHVPTFNFTGLPTIEDYLRNAKIFPDHARKIQTPFEEVWKLDPTNKDGVGSDYYGRHTFTQTHLIQIGIAKENLEAGKVPIIDGIVVRQIRDGTLKRFKDCKEFRGYPKYHFHFIANEDVCYKRYLERLKRLKSYDSKRYPMNKELTREEFHNFVTQEQPMIPKELDNYEHLQVDTSTQDPVECAQNCLDYIIRTNEHN